MIRPSNMFGGLVAGLAFSFTAQTLSANAAESLTGKVLVDGSSTVFPISEAVGEEFQKLNKSVQVAVASSGTGGGFKKFCLGELDITGASRPIEKTEIEICEKTKTSFVELPVAYDGIALVTHKSNTWATTLTTEELKRIWEPESKIKNWKDVRAGFPDVPLVLFGPGPDSGTFDYFTKVINKKEKASRTDFTASESDFTLVKGVAGEKGSLGYFGVAYYETNNTKINVVAIDAGKGAITPTAQTIGSGTYAPLSRPLFIYVSSNALARPEVKAFAEFYINSADKLVSEVGYVSLGQGLYGSVLNRLTSQTAGTLFVDHSSQSQVSIADLLKSTKATKTK